MKKVLLFLLLAVSTMLSSYDLHLIGEGFIAATEPTVTIFDIDPIKGGH